MFDRAAPFALGLNGQYSSEADAVSADSSIGLESESEHPKSSPKGIDLLTEAGGVEQISVEVDKLLPGLEPESAFETVFDPVTGVYRLKSKQTETGHFDLNQSQVGSSPRTGEESQEFGGNPEAAKVGGTTFPLSFRFPDGQLESRGQESKAEGDELRELESPANRESEHLSNPADRD
jgi:hypothetical protein